MKSDEAYVVINDIRTLSGNSKQDFLKVQDLGICKYLKAAYDPFTKYYITNCRDGKGDQQFNSITWILLEKLSTRELSGFDALTTVNSITEGMTPLSADLFRMILKKDLRMGMGAKSINKVFPGLIPSHDVMLAKPFDASRLRFPCFGSPKIDGVRSKFKHGKFYSRNGHEYVGLGRLINEIKDVCEELDGELIVPDETFQKSSGMIRSDNITPDAEFWVFDIPTLNVPFIERLIAIEDIDFATGPNIKFVQHDKLINKDFVMEYYDACRGSGFEGAVIKPYNYQYKGTRSYDWMKMKPTETVDLKVIDLYEGKGKYEGQMGGANVMFEGKLNRVGGGWSDNQRKAFWERPMMIIDKTIEVWYMEKTDEGNMRHARFINFRPDLD